MPARRSSSTGSAPLLGAGLVAVLGVLLLIWGTVLLTSPSSVDAYSFDHPVAAQATASPFPGQPVAPLQRGRDERVASGGTPAEMNPVAVSPTRVSFPDASVVADVIPVAVLASGVLQLPDDPAQVGWWVGGAAPGQPHGTTVLAGHIAAAGRSGAMGVLLDVAAGQTVEVEDRRGDLHQYRIVSRSSSPKQDLDPALFATGGPSRLVLITCGGAFDEETGRYADNVVVIAEPVLD